VVDLVNLPWLVGKHSWTSVHLAGFRVRFDPFAHLGRGLHGRDLANIENYQLIPVWNIFRVRPRPELAAVTGLGDLSAALRLGFVPDGLAGHRAQLRAATGGRDIDFLVVWKGDPDLAVAPELRGLLDEVRAHLNAEFVLVGRSAPHGRAEVWRRRQPPDAAAKRRDE
jgi:hypothetical protein